MKQLLAALLMLTCFSAHAALYKWVDPHGRVQYSDIPPPASMKSSTLRSSPATSDTPAPEASEAPAASREAPAASAPEETQSEADREAEQKRREAEQEKLEAEKRAATEKAEQEKAQTEAKKMNCDISQRNLGTLQSGVRLSEVNAAGERVYLDEEQIKQRIEKARQEISKYCN